MKPPLVFMLIIGLLKTNVYGTEEQAVKRRSMLDGRLGEVHVYDVSGR